MSRAREETTVGTMETTRGTRRPAVLAVVAAVALAASVLVAVGRDGGPPVIRLGAAGAGGQTTMEAAAEDLAVSRLAAVEFRFELTDGARFPAGEASAYRLEPPADLEAATRDLADRLGLTGEVVTSPWGDGALQVGATDGSGPTLWVGPAGDWNFDDPTALPEVRCVEAEPMPAEPMPVEPDEGIGDGAGAPADADGEAEGGGVSGDPGTAESRELVHPEPCEPVPPPAGIPDETEARAAAERFFAGLDLPGTPRITDAYGDDWSAWVSARLQLDGHDSDLHVSVGFGPDAVVTSASGTLAAAVEVDRYPTIDAEAAVARLEAQQGWSGGAAGFGGSAATDTAGPLDPDTPVEAPAEHVDRPTPDPGAVEDDQLTILPAPDEPMGEPEVVTVTLVDADPVAQLTFDVDGTVWLLPGVRFSADDGGEWQVLTVADAYLDTDEPVTEPGEPEPAPLPEPEPLPGGEEPGEPGTLPGAPGADPGTGPGLEPEPGGGQGAPDQPDQPDTARAEAVARDVVGRSEEEAVLAIEQAGLVARTVMRDGEAFVVTDDWRTDRINLTVEREVVVQADVG
jgi:hypothetical protein